MYDDISIQKHIQDPTHDFAKHVMNSRETIRSIDGAEGVLGTPLDTPTVAVESF